MTSQTGTSANGGAPLVPCIARGEEQAFLSSPAGQRWAAVFAGADASASRPSGAGSAWTNNPASNGAADAEACSGICLVRDVRPDGSVALQVLLPPPNALLQRGAQQAPWRDQLAAMFAAIHQATIAPVSSASNGAGSNGTDKPASDTAAASVRPISSLEFVNGFHALVVDACADDRDSLMAMLGSCTRLVFRNHPATASNVRPSPAVCQAHAAFLFQLTQAPLLQELRVPDLFLPLGEGDISIIQILGQLRVLQLGAGVMHTDENEQAVLSLPLVQLEWTGWQNLKALATCPTITHLLLRNEHDLKLAASGALRRLPQLQRLELLNVPAWTGKFGQQTFMTLKDCAQLASLHLQLEDSSLMKEPQVKIDQMCQFLVKLSQLRCLELSGSACGGAFLQSLIGSLEHVRNNGEVDHSFRGFETLVLRGIRLGDVNWMLLEFSARGAAGLQFQSGWHPANFLRLQELQLVDCEQHGCMLPYLALLPDLRTVRLLSSSVECDPLLPPPAPLRGTAGPACTNADMYAVVAPKPLEVRDVMQREASEAAAEARLLGRPVLPPIRALDFLCLAECPALTRLECQYPVRACMAEKDDPRMNSREELEFHLLTLRAAGFAGKGNQTPLRVSWGRLPAGK